MNTLLFVKNIDTIKKNKKYIEKISSECIAVSDNYGVIKNLETIGFKKTFLFDTDKTMLSKDTWDIVKQVNDVIDNTTGIKNNIFYEVSYLIETGITQVIHDCIYVMDFFKNVIDEEKVSCIVCDSSCVEEGLALKSIADSRDIKFGYLFHDSKIKFYLRKRIKRLYFLRNILQLTDWLKSRKLKCFHHVDQEIVYDIGFLHNGDSEKRIKWLLEEMLPRKSRFNVNVICLTKGAYTRLREAGYQVDFARGYGLIPENISMLFCNFLERRRIIGRLRSKLNLFFGDVKLTKLVIDLVDSYMGASSYANILTYNALREYFRTHKYKLITAKGDSNFLETRMAKEIIGKNNNESLFYRCLIEWMVFDSSYFPIYEPFANVFDFRIFNPDSSYLSELIKSGWSGEYYICEKDEDSNSIVSVADDDKLGIKDKVTILWAPSNPFRGLYTYGDFMKDTSEVISQCGKISGCTLYIKNHPNIDGYLEQWFKSLGDSYDYVQYIEKSESIDEYISSADIILTTPSTVIIDCARLKKPVICITSKPSFMSPVADYFMVINRNDLKLDKMIGDGLDGLRKVTLKQCRYFTEKVYIKTELKVDDVLEEKCNSLRERFG